MKKLIGIFLIIVGIIFGTYVGFWLLLVGGLADVVVQYKSSELNLYMLALRIIKVLSSAFAGIFLSYIFISSGKKLIEG